MPRFSIVIPVVPDTRPAVLDSIARLAFPRDGYEVLIEAGDNPSRNRNRAIGRAAGGIFAFTDDDCIVTANWLAAAAVFFDAHPDYDAVGGPQLTPPGSGFAERVSGYALASPFGAYAAHARYAPRPANLQATESELSSANLFVTRAALERHGLFDARLWPNEETELLERMAQRGAKIAYHPAIAVYHRRRRTLWGFAAQCFGYGTGRARQTLITGRRLPAAGVLVPCGFLAYLAALPLVAPWCPAAWLPLIVYAAASLAAAAVIAHARRDVGALPALPAFFAAIHLAYALGFMTETARLRLLRRKLPAAEVAHGRAGHATSGAAAPERARP